MKLRTIFLAMLAAGLGLASQAQAGMIGDSVTALYEFPYLGSVIHSNLGAFGPTTVGAGVEFPNIYSYNYISADFTDTQLIIVLHDATAWTGNVQLNGLVFIDTTHPFTTVSVDPATTAGEFASTVVSISRGDLIVNWEGQSFNAGDTLVLDLPAAAAVPEPLSMAVLGVGLAGLGMARRRPSWGRRPICVKVHGSVLHAMLWVGLAAA